MNKFFEALADAVLVSVVGAFVMALAFLSVGTLLTLLGVM